LDWASTVPEPIRKGLVEVSKVFVSMILLYYANCPSATQDQLGEQRAKNPLIRVNAHFLGNCHQSQQEWLQETFSCCPSSEFK
jgi:hypothetical protein